MRIGTLRTARTLVFFTVFLLAPAAHAERKDSLQPFYMSIMGGANVPENKDFQGSYALFIVMGSMVYPYLGFQGEVASTPITDDFDIYSGPSYEGAVSVKLAVPFTFVEPYVLAGAGLGLGYGGPRWGYLLHTAFGLDFKSGAFPIGVEVRRVWLEVDGRDFDSLQVMMKIGPEF